MSALPPFFFVTAIVGALLWMTDAPYPFGILGALIVLASVGGLTFSSAYVHEFMPLEWAHIVSPLKRLVARRGASRS